MAPRAPDCPSLGELLAGSEDPDSATAVVRAHLTACPACRDAVHETTAFLQTLSEDVAQDTLPGAAARRWQVRAALRARAPATPAPRRPPWPPVGLAVRAILVLVVIAGEQPTWGQEVLRRALQREQRVRADVAARELRLHVRAVPSGALDDAARCAYWEAIVEPEDILDDLPAGVVPLLQSFGLIPSRNARQPRRPLVAAYLAWRHRAIRGTGTDVVTEQGRTLTVHGRSHMGPVRRADLTVRSDTYDAIGLTLAADGCRVSVAPVVRPVAAR